MVTGGLGIGGWLVVPCHDEFLTAHSHAIVYIFVSSIESDKGKLGLGSERSLTSIREQVLLTSAAMLANYFFRITILLCKLRTSAGIMYPFFVARFASTIYPC